MPLPERTPGERKSVFIAKCMGDTKMKLEYPNTQQRYAVCVAQANR